jgi:hypothetical protein
MVELVDTAVGLVLLQFKDRMSHIIFVAWERLPNHSFFQIMI